MNGRIRFEGRQQLKNVDWLHKRYSFNPDNKFTLVVPKSLIRFLIEAEPLMWTVLPYDEVAEQKQANKEETAMGYKGIECPLCGKKYATEGNLNNHKRFCKGVDTKV